MTVIVSSMIKSNVPQIDGRLSITEVHVSTAGEEITRSYKAPEGSNMNALLAQHAISIGEGLIESEKGHFVGEALSGVNVVDMTRKYITKKQALRAVLKHLLVTRARDARLMINTLNALTDDNIMAVFPNKLDKIKRRRTRLNEIQVKVDVDDEDVEN